MSRLTRSVVALVLFLASPLAADSPAKVSPDDAAAKALKEAPPTLTSEQYINLYAGPAPQAQGETLEDIPAVQVFVPDPAKGDKPATGAAFVVCPGGGYGMRASHEGPLVAQWFARNGVTAFALRYRLGGKYHHPVELGDAQRAIRFVRAHAEAWKLDPKRIGIIGFSAGGHLASSAATHYTAGDPNATDPVERVSSRPDLQILVYPVVTMGEGTHAGSRQNLLGNSPDPALVELMSNEKQVTDQTPPAFLVHSTADTTVPIVNSDQYADALEKHHVEHEYVRGTFGNHGFGMKTNWTLPALAWLHKHHFTADEPTEKDAEPPKANGFHAWR